MTDIVLKQGATFKRTYRWGAPPKIYLTGEIVVGVPVTVTATAHGAPDQWPMQFLQADTDDCTCDTRVATVIDSDTLEFNSYVSPDLLPGTPVTLSYLTPVVLTGFTAELQIRSSARATAPLLTITSADGDIVIDAANNAIHVTISATDTAALDFSNAVFQLELTNAGDVTRLDEGVVTLSREVVRA